MQLRFSSKSKGQTAIEYALILGLIILPLALAIQNTLKDSSDKSHDNFLRSIVSDSYGDEDRLGVIGRPYP